MKSSRQFNALVAAVVSAWATTAWGDTTSSWSSAVTGNWTDGTKWSTHPTAPNNGMPTGTNYLANISATGSAYTVGVGQSITVDGLALNSSSATVQQSAGTMTIAGPLDLKSGTYDLVGGTLKSARIQSEGGVFSISNQGTIPFMDGVTLATPLTVVQSTPVFIQNSMTLANMTVTLNGDITGGAAAAAHIYASGNTALGGTGTIVFNGSSSNSVGDYAGYNTGSFTIGSGITIQASTGGGYLGGNSGSGGGGSNSLINQGTVLISGNGTIVMNGVWTNQGTISQSGGFLSLGGIFAATDLGHFIRTGGEVDLAGTLTNTGKTMDLSTTTGSLVGNGGTIVGGTISSSGSATFSFGNGVTWTGVTLGSDLTVPATAVGTLAVSGGLNLGGNTFNLATGSTVAVSGTISGGGTILVAPPVSGSNPRTVITGDSFTIGNGVTVRASGANNPLTVTGTNWTNQGSLVANSSSAALYLSGNWINQGTIAISNKGTVNLGGTVTTAGLGIITRAEGSADSLIFTGSLNNSGATLNLDSTGPVQIQGGTITGGAISTTTGADLIVNGGVTNTLDGITLGANLTVITGQTLSIADGLTLNHSTLKLQSIATGGAMVRFVGTQTLAGSGTILLDGPGVYTSAVTYTGDTVTVGSEITITTTAGSGGSFGSPGFYFYGIAVPGTGGSLTLNNMYLDGTVNIPLGTTVTINGINNAGIISNNGTLNLGGNVVMSQIGTLSTTGKINLTGFLDNTGSVFNQPGWGLANGGQISGGTIVSPLTVTGQGRLSGVTLSSTLIDAAGTLLLLFPTTNLNNGEIDVIGAPAGAAATRILFYGDQSLTGTGAVVLDATTNTTLLPINALTLGSGIKLSATTGGGTVGSATGNSLINNGTISAVSSNAVINLATSSLTNNATIVASAGGTINIAAGLWTNAGSITADGGTLGLTYPWNNTGSIRASNGGTINVAGTITPPVLSQFFFAGTNTVNIVGTLNNIGNRLDANALGANLGLMGGTINGGTIAHALNVNNGTFNGVVIASSAAVTMTGPLTILGASTNAGSINGSSTNLIIGQSGTTTASLNNSGAISLPNGSVTVFGSLNSSGPVNVANLINYGQITLIGSTSQFGPVTTNGSLNVNAGANLTAISIRQSNLSVGGILTIEPRPSGASAATTLSVVGSLNLSSGGVIDLGNSDLVVHSANAAAIQAALVAGNAMETWVGTTGIRSSAAAGSKLYTLGGIFNESKGVTILSTFDGQGAALNDELIKYTYDGDANLDGKVDGSDYSLIDSGYASNGKSTGWYNGDFNYDGVVDGSDYTLIDNAFNNQAPNLNAVASSQAAAVPEPGNIAFTAIPLIGLLCRRRVL